MFISFLHGLKMGKQQVNSQCKFPDTADTVVYVGILQISGGSSQTNTCIYYQIHKTLVTEVVSQGRMTRKILAQKQD